MSMKRKKLTLLAPLLALILVGCSKEEFGNNPGRYSHSVGARQSFSNSACSYSSVVKPKVDMIFIFDNSTSSFYLNQTTRRNILRALRGTVFTAAQRYDYRIIVAPLIANSRTAPYTSGVSAVVSDDTGITSTGKGLIVGSSDNQLVDRAVSIAAVPGSVENGFNRAKDLINYHATYPNGATKILRPQANTIITVFSNEDVEWPLSGDGYRTGSWYTRKFNGNKDALITLSNSLRALQFRFITVVPRTSRHYRTMSSEIYQHNLSSKTGFRSIASTPYDTFDLEGRNFDHIFSSINQTLTNVVVPHTYNYWPITDKQPALGGGAPFDPDSIEVYKHTSNNNYTQLPQSSSNGWTLLADSGGNPLRTTQNTRLTPSIGEPHTGYFIQLHGSAQVTYPECIRIETSEPFDYYGYIVTSEKPSEPLGSNVQYRKNGQSYSQSNSNGWHYLGYRRGINVRVTARTGHSSGLPEVRKTGYVFQLFGSAIYANGDRVELIVNPAPIR